MIKLKNMFLIWLGALIIYGVILLAFIALVILVAKAIW